MFNQMRRLTGISAPVYFSLTRPYFPHASCLAASLTSHRDGCKRRETNPTGCWFEDDSLDQSREIKLRDVISKNKQTDRQRLAVKR